MHAFLRLARDRVDLVALGLLVLAVPFLPGGVPGGIYGVGLVAGAGLALNAVGLVLVYRSHRIINVSQMQVGIVAAVLFRLMVEQRVLLRGLHAICEPCVERETGALLATNYWLSLALSLGAAVGLAWVIHAFVVKRFADAPRLVLTIATIGVAQLLGSLQEALPGVFATAEQRELSAIPRGIAAPPPVDVSVGWSPAIFRLPDILTIAVAGVVLGWLVRSMRASRGGVAIRAAAENPARASTLGIDVDRLSGRVWLIAGALSGIAGILGAMSSASPETGALSVAALVRVLAVAVIAGMSSIPIAIAAAFALGLFDQGMLWVFGSTTSVDGLLTVVILGVLLLQRARTSRAEQELVGAWRAAREARPTPAELKDLPPVRRWRRIGVIAGVVALLGAPFALTPTQVNLGAIIPIFAIVGMSLLILSGWAGQISLGQFALAAVGATVAALAASDLGLPLLLALILGVLAGALVAVLVGIPALRMRGLHLAITTLAVAVATSAVLLNPDMLGGHLPTDLERPVFLGLDLNDHRTFFYVAVAMLGLVVAATLGLRRSKVGRALLAARDNEAAAQSYGVNLVRARLTAFAISGGFAGLAGGLFAYHQGGVHAASFSPEVSITMFVMAVIGGLGSVAGPILGAAYVGALSLAAVSPFVLFLATGGGLVVLLLMLPGGIAQLVFDVRDAMLRRVAQRYDIAVPSLLGDRVTGDARLPIAAGAAFVPRRYRLDGQWRIAPEETPTP
ncbi:MAG TPA: ABC transporter permease [Actinomycetota bacterium]